MPTDNAGKIFASLDSWKTQSTFRVSASLHEPVEYERLERAYRKTLKRFPHFTSYLRPGLFWPYFESTEDIPPIMPDSRYPVARMSARERRRFPFRLRVYNTTISLEAAHVLTDGFGAMAFLLTLLAEYLQYKGPRQPEMGILRVDEPCSPEELENAFDRYYRKGLPKWKRLSPAFWVPLTPDVRDVRHITIATLDSAAVSTLAKASQATVGEYVTANYLFALQEFFAKMPISRQRNARGPLRLDIPMNLRGVMPSGTLRNFFLPLFSDIDPRLAFYSFEEILQRVSLQMRLQKDIHQLRQILARNVSASRNVFLRYIPLMLKDIAMPTIYNRWNLSATTSGLSNLGQIRLPAEMQEKVARIDMIPTHPSGRGITCAMVGYGDKLRVTFNRIFVESDIEQYFFRQLASRGLQVDIESNEHLT